MMHHQTKFGYKRFSNSEDTIRSYSKNSHTLKSPVTLTLRIWHTTKPGLVTKDNEFPKIYSRQCLDTWTDGHNDSNVYSK